MSENRAKQLLVQALCASFSRDMRGRLSLICDSILAIDRFYRGRKETRGRVLNRIRSPFFENRPRLFGEYTESAEGV